MRGLMKKNNMSGYRVCRVGWHGLFRTHVFRLLGCCLVTLGLVLGQCCGALANVPAGDSSFKVSPKVREFEQRLDQLLAPITYVYSPAGKPDPFQPFLRAKPAHMVKKNGIKKVRLRKPDACATPLECMDVGQLRLVAIVIEDAGQNMAMAQDASGIGYILTPGMSVGYRNGYVKTILPDRVVVEEETENIRGEMVMTQRVLFLHPEEK